MNLFAAPAPRWTTIAAHRPFLADLARALLETLGTAAMTEAIVLVPNRRSARGLTEALARAAPAGALLLPQICALGDLEAGDAPFEIGNVGARLPSAIGPGRRRYELAGLAAAHMAGEGATLDAQSALDLADSLGAFLDSCQIEEQGDPALLAELAGEAFAEHWQVSARFLGYALEAWPKRLQALGVIDIAQRRVALMRGLAERWRDAPPQNPVIAAGSTGAAPADADLLIAIAAAPRGCVVLPGLDLALAESAWQAVGEDHPQGALKRLLDRAGVSRGAVAPLDPAAEGARPGRWRRRLINEALAPAQATVDWLPRVAELVAEGRASGAADPVAEGLAGLSLARVRDEHEAAALAAVLLRETLETPGRTAALVTPDLALARRTTAALCRWGVEAEVSAGSPLAAAPAAVLAALVARWVAEPTDPVALLAIAKHPLTRLGLRPRDLGAARQAIERHGLRGLRPGGWDGLHRRLETAGRRNRETAEAAWVDGARDMVERLRAALALAGAPFSAGQAAPAAGARALAEALEALARGPDGEPGALWAGEGGEALAGLIAELIEESGALPSATAAGFHRLLTGLFDRQQVARRIGEAHPRVRILGVLEARLISADRLILAGLEEGIWPAAATIDPLLSRPMRERLGLPPPERRIGLSAHDFAQSAAAPEVVLVVCDRRSGAPAVASRWIWRLQTLVRGAQATIAGRADALAWTRALDAPLADPPQSLKTAVRPCPKPPLSARPRRAPVTAIERWVRDPYGFYAQRILGLRPLDRPDARAEAPARGSAFHDAMEAFARAWPTLSPDDAARHFADLLVRHLVEAGMPSFRCVRETALAEHLAPWVAEFERRRRDGARVVVETEGEIAIPGVERPFLLTARADRVEVRGRTADIIDFKTGRPPSRKEVESGLAPQLTLTAAILQLGGFPEIGPKQPGELLYVRLSGGRGLEEPRARGDAPARANKALARLARLVAHYDDPACGYLSWAAPHLIGSGGDYDRLARVWEWWVIGEPEGESDLEAAP